MLSHPLFSFFLGTYFFLSNRSSAIVISDRDGDIGLGFNDEGVDLDLGFVPSSPGIDDNDDALFAITSLDPGIPAPDDALDEQQPFSSFSETVVPDQEDPSLFALPLTPPDEIFLSSTTPAAPLENENEKAEEELISLTPTPVIPPISNEADEYPPLLPNTDFNIYKSCHGKDIQGFERACDIARCAYNNPYNPQTNNHEPQTDLLCCPQDPPLPQTHHFSSFNSQSCTPYSPSLPACQFSRDLQCCFTLFEPFSCTQSHLRLPSRWREPAGIEAWDTTVRVLKTEINIPCERWWMTLGVFECGVEPPGYYDTRCCEVENYGVF